MSNRSRRFVFQGSGVALAAIVVVSMSAPHHFAVGASQTVDRSGRSTLSTAGKVSIDRRAVTLHATNIDDPIGAEIRHHYP